MFNFRKNQFNSNNPYDAQGSSRLKKMIRLVIVLIVFASLLLVGKAVYGQVQNNPARVSKKFVNYLKQGKTDKSYELGSASFKFKVDKNDWKNEAAVYKALFTGDIGGIGKVELKDFDKSNSAEAYGYNVSGDDANYSLTVYVEYIENRWQVSKFSVDQTKK